MIPTHASPSLMFLTLLSVFLLNKVQFYFTEADQDSQDIGLMISKQDDSLRGIRVQLYILGQNIS
jgi:hypothetical protein